MQEQEKANLDTQEESQEAKEASEVLEEQENNKEDKEALQEKIKELEEKYLRTYADFENTKKRLMREKDQSLEYAYEKFAKDLLSSIDTLEMALKSIKEAKESNEANEILGKIEEGIALTLDNLLKALAKNGVEPISIEGGFDPNFHDAIMQVASETHENGQIVAELQKGYKYKERVLRPSMVSIAKN